MVKLPTNHVLSHIYIYVKIGVLCIIYNNNTMRLLEINFSDEMRKCEFRMVTSSQKKEKKNGTRISLTN